MTSKTRTATSSSRRSRRRLRAVLATASGLAVLALAGPSTALAAPALGISSSHIPESAPTGTIAKYSIAVSNTGTDETSGNITVDFSVPAGLKVISVTDEIQQAFGLPIWDCTIAGDSVSASCTGPDSLGIFGGPLPIEPGQEACLGLLGVPCRIIATVRVDSDALPGAVTPAITACGGATTSCPTVGAIAPDDPVEIVPFAFHLTHFDGEFLQSNGDPATQAGSHPHTSANEFRFSTFLTPDSLELPVQQLKNAIIELPPGLLGNPRAIPTCTAVQLATGSNGSCPAESQIGTIILRFNGFSGAPGNPFLSRVALYNLTPPHGTPAAFGFNFAANLIHIYASVRTGEDYGINLTSLNAPQPLPFEGLAATFWGIPADPSNDAERRCSGTPTFGCTTTAPLAPFVSMPTSCSDPIETKMTAIGWEGGEDSASFLSHDNTLPTPNPIGLAGCNAVDFSPALEARPTTTVADSPSGLDVDLQVPQLDSCDPGPPVTCEPAEAHLRDTTVTLPEGLVINPSGANGLDGCSLSEFGYTSTDPDGTIHTTPDPATCSDASKQGTVAVETPLIDHPLKGSVYLADPFDNPFDSLLALYISVDDPQTGITVKLAGEVTTNPTTGQISATFKQNPQTPFEDFKLRFFGGAGGPLRTPATCGQYTTTSSMTPWSAPESGPPDTPSDTWAITQAPGGGTCPASQGARPNNPDLDAGSVSPIAATYTPSVVNLRRADGSQEFSTVSLTLPPGLTGKLAGIEQCSNAALATAASKSGNQEKASPSCPANSRIGTVDVAAGAGPAPYHAQGTAYLTGPYKGAPLGMAIVTPATAGPFDLGTVVVRVALHLDPTTGQITATSDLIPSILQGIPLDVRSAQVKLDRSGFTRNGTSCDPLSFSGSLTSTLGQVAPLSERFQLGECGRLAFKPKLGIRLIGGTKRGAHPALKATLAMPEGANIARASVALPKSEFLDQGHIGTVCTRVQFAADDCPAASVYGRATATSPLVGYPLSGSAYLRSSSNKLPDLVVALHGPPSQPVEVDVVGRIDSVKGGIRTTFEGVPDLPVSSFTLEMEGGRKGLLQNSTNICRKPFKATAEFDAQNGKVADLAPLLKNSKCGKAKKRKGAQRAKHRAAQRAVR